MPPLIAEGPPILHLPDGVELRLVPYSARIPIPRGDRLIYQSARRQRQALRLARKRGRRERWPRKTRREVRRSLYGPSLWTVLEAQMQILAMRRQTELIYMLCGDDRDRTAPARGTDEE